MQLFEKMFHVDMSPRRIILIPIMCIIFVTYDIVMTYIKFMDGRQIEKSLFVALAVKVLFCTMVLFAYKNKYWRMGFLILIISSVIHAFARLPIGMASLYVVMLHYVSFFIVALSAACFVVMFINGKRMRDALDRLTLDV